MIKIIQGNTKKILVKVTKGTDLIEKVYFSSKYLNIVEECQKIEEGKYLISFDSDTTANWKPGKATFDITVTLKENQVATPIYNDVIVVLKKENSIW